MSQPLDLDAIRDAVLRRMSDYYGADSLTLGNLVAAFADVQAAVSHTEETPQ